MYLGLAKVIRKHPFFSTLVLLSPGTDSSGSHRVMNQSILTYAANRTWISFKIRSSVLSAHDFIIPGTLASPNIEEMWNFHTSFPDSYNGSPTHLLWSLPILFSTQKPNHKKLFPLSSISQLWRLLTIVSFKWRVLILWRIYLLQTNKKCKCVRVCVYVQSPPPSRKIIYAIFQKGHDAYIMKCLWFIRMSMFCCFLNETAIALY